MTEHSGVSTITTGATRGPASTVRAYLPIAVALGILALVPLRFGDSRLFMGLAVGGAVLACYAVAFNLIFGSTGQLFLCNGALAGIGAYGAAIFADQMGMPLVASLAIAAAVSGVVGGLLSWVAVRRSLDVIFVGIVTLAFSLSFHNLLLGRRELTGGETGLRISAGADTVLRTRVTAYFVVLALLGLYLVIYRVLQRSHIGWAFRALRDDEQAAELTGVNVARYRVYAGVIGSLMLGFAGGLFGFVEGFMSPTIVDFGHVDIRVLVLLAFGGIGTLLGPVIGATIFTVIDELLATQGQLRVVLYGALIVGLFLGFRKGLVPQLSALFKRGRA